MYFLKDSIDGISTGVLDLYSSHFGLLAYFKSFFLSRSGIPLTSLIKYVTNVGETNANNFCGADKAGNARK